MIRSESAYGESWMRYRRSDHLYSGILLYLLLVYNYIIRLKYMYNHNLIALLVMSIIIIVFGIVLTGVLINKKLNNKTKTLYMGISGFMIIAILIAFFYLVPVNVKNL